MKIMNEVVAEISEKISEIEEPIRERHPDWNEKMIKARNPAAGGKIEGLKIGQEIVLNAAEKITEIGRNANRKMVENAIDRLNQKGVFHVVKSMENETAYAVAKSLNQMGIKTPKNSEWKPNQVERVRKMIERVQPDEILPPPPPPAPTMTNEEMTNEEVETIRKIMKKFSSKEKFLKKLNQII